MPLGRPRCSCAFRAALILVIGGVYLTARKDGVTFREAVFNWPIVILAAGMVFLALL